MRDKLRRIGREVKGALRFQGQVLVGYGRAFVYFTPLALLLPEVRERKRRERERRKRLP